MQQIVTKFGGTSVSTCENWQNIVAITQNHIKNKVKPVIVCSAISQASNQLETMIEGACEDNYHEILSAFKKNYQSLAKSLAIDSNIFAEDFESLDKWLKGIALLKTAPAKIKAQILSLGELLLTKLGALYLQSQGIDCLWYDAREAIKTISTEKQGEHDYLAAECIPEVNKSLQNYFNKIPQKAIITQGFIGANTDGETVTLGRGGSDTSAALFAAILNAKACEIWTDVPGIYTANPHLLPNARLLKKLSYLEAQEIATQGAKVLHPNCLPPLRRSSIPLDVKYTKMPVHSGTRITNETDLDAPPIKSIQVKHNVTLVSIDTLSMWQQVGFLADAFQVFKKYGLSVDLLSSSESNVTVSLDVNHKLLDRKVLPNLIEELNRFCRAKIIEPCSAVSLVGHNIRRVLHQLGPSLEVFEAQLVHMLSLASNDLNLTFVVDRNQADKLCQKLHTLLIENNPQSYYYSKSFHEEFGKKTHQPKPWWQTKRKELLNIALESSPCYVYDLETISKQALKLKSLKSLDKIFYAIKANAKQEILELLYNNGINFECVSKAEIDYIFSIFPDIEVQRVLFTPNFTSKDEYAYAIKKGVNVTVDSVYPLEAWPQVFSGNNIILRLDPGSGRGHHKYVCTAGNESKFGIPRASLDSVADLSHKHNIKVVGLHAHSGSGILTPELWALTANTLMKAAKKFKDVRILNLGGGLGIVEKPGQNPLDLEAVDTSLKAIKDERFEFWLEPGRYFVAKSGVLLAKVTQSKQKGKVHFVGVETGMNSLIRPALYGSYHEIVNLSRLASEKEIVAHIVGPICESGDTLGYDRYLPKTIEGDIMLIATAGAYGYCMSSNYNLREPACEIVI